MILYRMCIVSRKRVNRSKLIKITKINHEWQVDEKQNLFGRSFYLDLNDVNLEKFKNQRKRLKIESANLVVIINTLKELNGKDS